MPQNTYLGYVPKTNGSDAYLRYSRSSMPDVDDLPALEAEVEHSKPRVVFNAAQLLQALPIRPSDLYLEDTGDVPFVHANKQERLNAIAAMESPLSPPRLTLNETPKDLVSHTFTPEEEILLKELESTHDLELSKKDDETDRIKQSMQTSIEEKQRLITSLM